MRRLQDLEGYFMMDHRHSAPVSDAAIAAAHLPVGAGRGLFEAPSYICSHCQRMVVLNPSRNRERSYCRGCDHYLCDACGARRAAGVPCKTFKQIADEILEQAERKNRRVA